MQRISLRCARKPRHSLLETSMKKLMSALMLVLGTLSFAAHAADAACEAKATEKKLAGAAKTSFMKKCESDTANTTCETQAADKKLAGAAKASFVKKCATDSKASAKGEAMKTAQATCDTQAGDKKLAGAAKNSFVKKCVADASK
jgi:hypothetical protein